MSSSERDQRLAAKLRENLKRRKAQAKARALSGDEPSEREDTAPDIGAEQHKSDPPKS